MTYRRDIQGIRGIGVLVILLGHLGLPSFRGGYIMVDAFYVVSGFVITSTLIYEHKYRVANGLGSGFSIIGFYLRRLKRIFPMAVVGIGASVWLAHHYWNPLRAAGVYRDAWWAFLSAANINEIRKASDYFAQFDAHSPLAHYWSLAVEEQFYLVWPAAALLLLKWGLSKGENRWRKQMLLFLGAAGVLSLAYSVWFTYHNINAAYFSTFTRAWQLAGGAMLAVVVDYAKFQQWVARPRGPKMLWLAGFAAVTYSAVKFDDNTWFPGYMALVPTLGSLAVIAAGVNPVLARTRIFDNPVLVFCGKISFSLYVWHWPVIMFIPAVFPALSDGQGGITLEGKIAAIGVAYALAVVSYLLIERPIIRLPIGVPKAARRPVAAGAFLRSLRQSGSALGTAWVVTAVAFVSVTVSIAAPQQSLGNVEQAAIDHQDLVIHAQKQDGPITQQWKRTLETATQAIRDQATPAQIADLRTGTVYPDKADWLCDGKYLECFAGKDTAAVRVLVIGDSHTFMWAGALKKIVSEHPEVAVAISVTGQCPNSYDLTDLAKIPAARKRIFIEQCSTYHKWIREKAERHPPDVIVFSDYSQGYLNSVGADLYIKGYVKFINWAKQVSPRVLILGAVPEWPVPSRCLSKDFASVRWCTGNVNRVADAVNFQRAAAKLAKINYIETFSWFCVKSTCPLFIGSHAVTIEGYHISQSMGISLSNVLWENLKPKIEN